MRTDRDSRVTGAGGGFESPAGDPEAPPGDPEAVARIVCLRMLERRARTRAELAAALHRKGVPDDAAAAVLSRFAEVGLIDDAALAEGYALAQHRERGLAGRAVAMKLRRRGIEDEVVQSAVAQIDVESERSAAEQLVARKLRSLGGLTPEAQARRLVGLLARRGYSPGLAHEVVRAALSRSEGYGSALDGSARDGTASDWAIEVWLGCPAFAGLRSAHLICSPGVHNLGVPGVTRIARIDRSIESLEEVPTVGLPGQLVARHRQIVRRR